MRFWDDWTNRVRHVGRRLRFDQELEEGIRVPHRYPSRGAAAKRPLQRRGADASAQGVRVGHSHARRIA